MSARSDNEAQLRAFTAVEQSTITVGNPQQVEGHPAQVSDRYNKNVDPVNSVRW